MAGPLDASPPRPAGWRRWLRRAAHHFLPEEPAVPHERGTRPAEPPARASEPSGGDTTLEPHESLDHVLRNALEARTPPPEDPGSGSDTPSS